MAAGDEEVRMRAGKAGATARKHDDGKKTTGWPKLEGLLGQDGKEIVRRVREWLGMIPAKAVAASARTKKARELPRYQDFPVDALPFPLKEYISQGALALGCDPSYLALPALAVVASCVGNTRTIRLKRALGSNRASFGLLLWAIPEL